MNNFTVKADLRDYVSKKTGLSNVQIVVSFQSRNFRKPLSISVRSDQFKERKVINHPDAFNFNAIIQAEISDIQFQLLDAQRKKTLSKHLIKAILRPEIQPTDETLADFIESQIALLKSSYSPDSIRGMESKLRKLKKFRDPVYFSDINVKFLSDIKTWMKKQGNEHNTIWDMEKFLDSMFKRAVPDLLPENPYNHFERSKYSENIPRYLDEEEIKKLQEFVNALAECNLKRAGIYFLADCEIGLRISDLCSFDPLQNIKGGRFIKKTQKGKTIVSMKVSDKLESYLKYICKNPFNMNQPTYDRLLKNLTKLSGIDTLLSSHVARHTLGRRLAKNRVNIKIAQKILGHKSITSTERYYHLDDEDIDEAIDMIS